LGAVIGMQNPYKAGLQLMIEVKYIYDEITPPKEIVFGACRDLALFLADKGYKFFKSKMEITKKNQ
jgi:hypothetical protein